MSRKIKQLSELGDWHTVLVRFAQRIGLSHLAVVTSGVALLVACGASEGVHDTPENDCSALEVGDVAFSWLNRR
jgi:hypothetical protein